MSDPNVVVARNTDKAPVSDLYSQTVAFSHYNNLSAQLPIDPATGAIVAGGAAEQAEQCFKNLKAIVESIGHDMNDIIRVSIFLADIMDLSAVEKVQASFFPTYQPARTVVAVDALPQGALVFIEALVDNGEGTQSVPQAGDLVKLTNNTHAAPYDAGSTQTVAFSHYNNITMQLPLDPGTGRPILGDVAAQTAQCLRNVKAILTSVDVPFDDIVKVTIFVKNLADASVVDEVYKTFFPDSGIARAVNYLPARTVVPVKDLPYHCDVAVEAVVSHGAVMIDNSSAFRMDEDVPLVVPEVNPGDVSWHNGVIANPNCSTIQMVVALKPLYDLARITRVVVSTYQAASGAGAPAMAELYDQTREFLDGKPEDELTIKAFKHRIAFNTIPHIDVFLDDDSTKEEWKMVAETKKIMGDEGVRVAATCVRVPVLRCHGESINVEFVGDVPPEAAREALAAAPGVTVMDDPANDVYPMPGLLAGTNDTYVGRIRRDPTVKHGLAMWVVADQIRKGAALNAVQIAQLLLPQE